MTILCTCWPSGGPPCREHGTVRVSPHHDHGVYCGDDNWDAECCICSNSPCGSVTVDDMVRHRWWDLEHWTARDERQEHAPF